MDKQSINDLFEPLYQKIHAPKNKGLISFCLYGSADLYCLGMLENIAEAKQYFPDWNLRVWVAEDVPVIVKLLQEEIDVFIMKKPQGNLGMFWRLLDITNRDYSYTLIRDADQRLNDKDAQAVNAWIKSGLKCHRMHEDSSQVYIELMGCAIGFKTDCISDIKPQIVDWLYRKKNTEVTYKTKGTAGREDFPRLLYGSDQVFLTEVVWPQVENSTLTHGILGEPFPPWDNNLKWDPNKDGFMFRRIAPNTNNTVVFGHRPQYAYDGESH